ncbi:GNAT family (ArgA) (PDB:2R98) [Commensalibacter communis]|uniref:GNAT family (ArgA) n=1 Tax=Commensalibacter communis TaxID=2972786 RepID=A0A9W4TLZ2_9PROT|nr:helix-turn-helix domain-containing GNAT family N-acetyltransferase [Commensalibacter communis]CAI3922181.1 GNAT family (ArgA) (PDB:2R98) [Commensalibacter communis]CAI3922938.1 GNAT family (ArgA) (PDB:2R98) [Commensalibacter communis]CAI3939574.1 GNAT family (ArgA) (PDB:2R98) [Commensalibacter communis]CAI3940151.1 GNAT family (ArgA) (PDB:2R98) [Commensalibacter communis]
MFDVLGEFGSVFLGSRLKRLGDRMQASAARIITNAGLPVQPGHMPILFALGREAMTINQIVKVVGISQPGITRSIGQLIDLGLLSSKVGIDQRHRTISLTAAGYKVMMKAQLYIFPQVEEAIDQLCGGYASKFLKQMKALEDSLVVTPLDVLASQIKIDVMMIEEFSDELAHYFQDINTEWIEAEYQLEDVDRKVLENPRDEIINTGGVILFVNVKGLGIVGTGALKKTGATSYELIKFGVFTKARGLKVGEFLLKEIIKRAMVMGADPLYLVSNKRAKAAIHLYEKLGFYHDDGIMKQYAGACERADVAMRYMPNR